jgi:uncharacterized protein DUF5615
VRVRFLADADLNEAIVRGILRREPALDFLTAQAAGLRGMKDPEVLALAAEQERVLVSHDVGTMPGQFRTLRTPGSSALDYFWYHRAWILGLQSRNCCSSGLHQKPQNG